MLLMTRLLWLLVSPLFIFFAANVSSSFFDIQSLISFHRQLFSNAIKLDAGLEGTSGTILNQTLGYFNIATAIAPLSLCEVGFNAGHSASTFLFASPSHASYLGFDLGKELSPIMTKRIKHGNHSYTTSSIEMIRSYFKNHSADDVTANSSSSSSRREKIKVVIGDSTVKVPEFFLQHVNFRCDLVHIDGGHFGNIPMVDFINMAFYAREDGKTVVIMDDTNCAIKDAMKKTAGCTKPEIAWKSMVNLKVVTSPECVELSRTRGYCSGYYNTNTLEILSTKRKYSSNGKVLKSLFDIYNISKQMRTIRTK